MTIRDILRHKGSGVTTITQERTVLEAVTLLVERNIGSVVVVSGDRPIGILTERDIISRVVARSWNNVLEPRELYELVGQVPNVVFPGGMIVEEHDAEGFAREDSAVKIYYGAADTCVGLATTTVGELLAACTAV